MKNFKIKFGVYLILVIILSGIYICYEWNRVIKANSAQILKMAKIAEAMIPKDVISILDANVTDIEKAEYGHIRKDLMNLAEIDSAIRFVYIYILRQGKLYILADSEPIQSKDYSPPGQEYTEADAQYFRPFNEKQALVTMPVADRWGKWISALVPIKNYDTGEVIAVFAIDYPVDIWRKSIFFHVLQTLLIVVSLSLLGMAFLVILNRNFQIKENERNFRAFFQTIDYMVLVCDKNGKIIFANEAVLKKLGYAYKDLKGMHVIDLNPDSQRKEAETIFSDMLAGKRDFCPLALQKKDGTLIPSETRVWFGKWGGDECVFGLVKDLTEEQELLQKFHKIFDNNPALMAISSIPERKFTDVNNTFIKKIGYTKAELLGKRSKDLKIFLEPEKEQLVSEEIIKNGYIYDVQLKVRTKSGDILDGVFSGEIIESQGKKYFLSVMIDQTMRKKAEDELIKKTSELERLNKIFIDRELKMIELKKEIEELKRFNNG